MDTIEPTRAVAESPVASPAVPVRDPRPWPRYFARMIDTVVLGAVAGLVLGIVLVLATESGADRYVAMTEGVGGLVVSNVLGYLLAIVPIAFLLAFAQTPGKWLFGIRVRDHEGRRLGLWKALQREAWVLVRGVGIGIPLVTLFTHISSFTDLKDDGTTAWDRALRCQVTHAPATRWWWVRAILGGALVVALSLWGYADWILSIARPQGG